VKRTGPRFAVGEFDSLGYATVTGAVVERASIDTQIAGSNFAMQCDETLVLQRPTGGGALSAKH
jgi:hypothetical protein